MNDRTNANDVPHGTWQAAVARTVEALGYDTVDVERSAGGLLRVTIDRVQGRSYPTGDSDNVTIEDCEAVTHQLQYALEVDQVSYERLEVSSPGLDRPLRKEADLERFVGEAADITLKAPLAGRRKFRGVLAVRDDGGWRLLLDDTIGTRHDTRERTRKASAPKAAAVPKAAASKAAAAKATADVSPDTVQTLDFDWNEVREARLVPVLDFKGRARAARDEPAVAGGLQR